MHIRSLEHKDQNNIEAIMREHSLQFPKFIIEKYPARWSKFLKSKEETKNDGYYVAIDDNDKILGHAGYIFNEDVGRFEIVGVAVKKDYQRQGIGQQLIHTICNKINDLGINEVILYTLGHVENETTLTFYRNIGFDMVNYEKDFFISDYHRVTFVKALVR
ncbi:GNAT family N-acetyltransferase [Paenibacillus silvae]|uniref:GNAT family N-acetyltransferase n=1 Tax=Paenibacillus silvae TaxID=1325358 RepID=A0A2W6N8V5_9BACL|nr:GNAT family N-acetyltransferase [Paenibacillus silvae]PZT52131.1 GNAT family N-acetyltransferase [Paenibacillus silvae]